MAKVVIVDKYDNVIGAMERAEAIKQQQIVRIVRILLFNSKGELFLQKRAQNVNYPGLWDQSAGGHVDEGEDYITAAKRELFEEIGLENVELNEITKYYSDFEHDAKIMKRFNALYIVKSDKTLRLNPSEVAEGKWVTLTELDNFIKTNPHKLTQGFIKAYNLYLSKSNSGL